MMIVPSMIVSFQINFFQFNNLTPASMETLLKVNTIVNSELPYDIFVSWQILQPQLNNYSNKLFHQKCTINSTNGTLVCDVCQI